jgi:hypothetical protein
MWPPRGSASIGLLFLGIGVAAAFLLGTLLFQERGAQPREPEAARPAGRGREAALPAAVRSPEPHQPAEPASQARPLPLSAPRAASAFRGPAPPDPPLPTGTYHN